MTAHTARLSDRQARLLVETAQIFDAPGVEPILQAA